MSTINIISILLFFLSPFLALPTVLIGVLKKNTFSIILFIVSISFLGYLYLPNYADDKTRYLEIYENFGDWDYLPFILYNLKHSQDFILQLMFKLASDIGISPQWVFYIIILIILIILFKIINGISIAYHYTKSELILAILLVISSLTFLDLLSGTRFVFAAVICLLGFYEGLFLKKRFIGLFFVFLAINIHFSLLAFALVYSILAFTTIGLGYFKILFVLSFIFLVLPKEFLITVFSSLGLGGALGAKADAYLKLKDFSTNYFKEAGAAGVIIEFIQSIWIYLLYIFLFTKLKTKDGSYKLLLLTTAVLNSFYSVPTVYFRYAIFVKFLLVVFLLMNLKEQKLNKYWFCFLFAFISVQIVNIIIMRYNIEASYTLKTFLLIDILIQDPMTSSQTLR